MYHKSCLPDVRRKSRIPGQISQRREAYVHSHEFQHAGCERVESARCPDAPVTRLSSALDGSTGDENSLSALPCSAGRTAGYVPPYGDVFPCVQFPLPTGNVRKQKFLDIWRHSEKINEVGSIRLKDLTTCTSCTHVGSCTRCPGLAYMEGNMRGPSSQDCEKSFARTGMPSANMLAK